MKTQTKVLIIGDGVAYQPTEIIKKDIELKIEINGVFFQQTSLMKLYTILKA